MKTRKASLPSPKRTAPPKRGESREPDRKGIDAFAAEAVKRLSSTPYGQMALLLDHSGRLRAMQVDAQAAAMAQSSDKGAWHLLSCDLQQALRRRYRGHTKVSARSIWWHFARIHRDVILANAPKPLAALRPLRDLRADKSIPEDYIQSDLRAWGITERQAGKAWSARDGKRRVLSKEDKALYVAGSSNFDILRQLAREGRHVHIPTRERIDQAALATAYQERIGRGVSRSVAIANLAKCFRCSSGYVRHILRKRNL